VWRLGREPTYACLIPDARICPVLPRGGTHAWAHAPHRRYAQLMTDRRAYPSDLSDARWELIEPVLSAWRFERRGRALDFGRPPRHDLREIMNAILYVDRTGCQWAYLPHDFPPHQTLYGYFAKWQTDGIFAQLNGLRELVRQQEGKHRHPSACVIDAQSVKTSTSVPARTPNTSTSANHPSAALGPAS
jgi:transposase